MLFEIAKSPAFTGVQKKFALLTARPRARPAKLPVKDKSLKTLITIRIAFASSFTYDFLCSRAKKISRLLIHCLVRPAMRSSSPSVKGCCPDVTVIPAAARDINAQFYCDADITSMLRARRRASVNGGERITRRAEMLIGKMRVLDTRRVVLV